MITAETLRRLWPDADDDLIDGIAESAETVLPKYGLNTPLRVAHFMAHVSVETGGGRTLSENLNYSARRIRQVWPNRPRAAQFAHNPKGLAKAVYNGRMGNRPGTDDGWTYRGRGLIQITGRAMYAKIGAKTGLDLVNHPDLAIEPQHALEVAACFWQQANVSRFSDRDDIVGSTRRVNGGLTNLAQRRIWLTRWKKALVRKYTPGSVKAGMAGGVAIGAEGLNHTDKIPTLLEGARDMLSQAEPLLAWAGTAVTVVGVAIAAWMLYRHFFVNPNEPAALPLPDEPDTDGGDDADGDDGDQKDNE